MTKYSFILIAVFSLLLAQCKVKEKNIDYEYEIVEEDIILNPPVYDSITVAQRIIIPKTIVLPILDSIVKSVKKCPSPFRYSELPLRINIHAYEEGSKQYLLLATYTNKLGIGATYIFNYLNYDFFYSGVFFKELFEDTGIIVNKQYADPTKTITDIDDRGFLWLLIIKDSGFEWDYINTCDTIWTRD